jgi:hypothetical protein
MRWRWLAVLVVICVFMGVTRAQQTANSMPVRDWRGMLVLQQAVQAAGGLRAIDAVQSYSASGRITFYWTEDGTEGDLIMKGRGVHDFRLDAHMANGIEEWWAIKDWSGFKKEADGRVRYLPSQELANIQSLCSPRAQLANAILDSRVAVTFLGTHAREGRTSFGIRIRSANAPSGPGDIGGKLSEKDFYIDAQTFQITTVEDFSYPRENIAGGIRRRITFADYRNVDGTFFPFSISEQVGKRRRLMEIHLTEVSINVPLTDRDFMP